MASNMLFFKAFISTLLVALLLVFIFIKTSLRNLLFTLLLAPAMMLAVRVCLVLPALSPRPRQQRNRGDPVHLLIVLGSGGHSTEMFMMCGDMDHETYVFRTYVANEGDALSVSNARYHEEVYLPKFHHRRENHGNYQIMLVPRARNIHQSLWTTPLSALACLKACLAILRGRQTMAYAGWFDFNTERPAVPYPDLILSNGPATGAIMMLAAFLLRLFDFTGTTKGRLQTVYVESWARVKSLSLSGKLLAMTGICDLMLSQWPRMHAVRFIIGLEPVFRGVFVGGKPSSS